MDIRPPPKTDILIIIMVVMFPFSSRREVVLRLFRHQTSYHHQMTQMSSVASISRRTMLIRRSARRFLSLTSADVYIIHSFMGARLGLTINMFFTFAFVIFVLMEFAYGVGSNFLI